jgi:hypothetical protein
MYTSIQWLGRSTESVLELAHKSIDFPFGATARVSVPSFQQEHQVVALAVDAVEFVRAELVPVVMQLFSTLFPFHNENVFLL